MRNRDENFSNLKCGITKSFLKVLLSFVVTAVSCFLVYVLNIPNPNVILFTVAVFFTFSGGFMSGIPSACVVLSYSLIFFSDDKGHLFHYSAINAEKVIVSAISIMIMVIMVGILVRRSDKKSTELLIANAKLESLSRIDPLTGLPNRRAFDDVYSREYANAIRMHTPLAIMILDIDFFKQYNDTYGHIAGDRCLHDISSVFNDVITRANDFVSRFGGEEFLALLPATNKEGAVNVAENIQRRIHELNIPHNSSTVDSRVTVSIGVVIARPDQQNDPTDFLNHADRALYQAKTKGRNRIAVYNQDN